MKLSNWLSFAAALIIMSACGHNYESHDRIGKTASDVDMHAGLRNTSSESSLQDEHPSLIEGCEARQKGSATAHDDCVAYAKQALPPKDGERRAVQDRAYPLFYGYQGYGYRPYYYYGR